MNRTKEAHESLTTEWRQFQAAWHSSQAIWKDEVAKQFEKRFISQLESDFPVFLRNLEALEAELTAAQRELR